MGCKVVRMWGEQERRNWNWYANEKSFFYKINKKEKRNKIKNECFIFFKINIL